MTKLIVASAQQQMRLFDSPENYRKELNRFVHMARAKGAGLIVFPALAGVMAASYKVEGFRVNLLKQADERHRGRGSLLARTRSALAGGTASLLGASFRKAFLNLLSADAAGVIESYERVFGDLARTYEMTVVAGSAFLPDAGGVIRHRAVVFGPDGAALGRHDKLALSPEDEGMATAGDAWHVVATPVGRVGILLGEEALYPEAGRVLAYQGADLLVTLAATASAGLAAYIRHGTLAAAQATRCFALTSFLVGKNHLGGEDAAPCLGKSGIYAPLEMTPHFTGILAEMGTSDAEGLLTAELDRDALAETWEHGIEPVRRRMPVDLFARYLPALYSSNRTLADVWPGAEQAAASAPTAPLAALPAPEPDSTGPVEPTLPPVEEAARVETASQSE